jgi:hypothetical protein
MILVQLTFTQELSDLTPEDSVEDSHDDYEDDSAGAFPPQPRRRMPSTNRAAEPVVKSRAPVEPMQCTTSTPTIEPVVAVALVPGIRPTSQIPPYVLLTSLNRSKKRLLVPDPDGQPIPRKKAKTNSSGPSGPRRHTSPEPLAKTTPSRPLPQRPPSSSESMAEPLAKTTPSRPLPQRPPSSSESVAEPLAKTTPSRTLPQRPPSPSESVADALNACSATALSSRPKPVAFPARGETVVPVGSSQKPKATIDHGPRRPPPVPSRELVSSRYGKRPQSAKRKLPVVLSSRESSVSRPVPPPLPPTQTAGTLIVPDQTSIVATLSTILKTEQAKTTALDKSLEEARAEITTHKITISSLKKDIGGSYVGVLRGDMAKLTEELAEAKTNNGAYLHTITGLTEDHAKATNAIDNYKRQVMALEEQLRQSQAAVAERDRSLTGFANFAGLIGSTIQVPQTLASSSSRQLQRVAPPYGVPPNVPTGPASYKPFQPHSRVIFFYICLRMYDTHTYAFFSKGI